MTPKPLPRGNELYVECKRLGIDTGGSGGPGEDAILQGRLLLVRAHQRQERLAWVAILAMVAAVLSAAAAWAAVLTTS